MFNKTKSLKISESPLELPKSDQLDHFDTSLFLKSFCLSFRKIHYVFLSYIEDSIGNNKRRKEKYKMIKILCKTSKIVGLSLII